jgi:hypothetical protein
MNTTMISARRTAGYLTLHLNVPFIDIYVEHLKNKSKRMRNLIANLHITIE